MSEVVEIDNPKVALAPVPNSTASSQFMDIVRDAAKDPTIDLDRVRELKGMYEEIRAGELKAEFDHSFAIMQSELPDIRKTRTNSHTNSKYADWSDVNALCQPVYSRHGFSLTFESGDVNEKDELRVDSHLSLNGHTETIGGWFPLDIAGSAGTKNKTRIQAIKSTCSYAKNILGQMQLNVTVTEHCNDGNKIESAPSERFNSFMDKISIVTADGFSLLKEELDASANERAFPPKEFNDIKMALMAKRKELDV